MLATILKSPNATQTTIAIVETFVKVRELSKALNRLPDIQEESQQKNLLQRSGELLAEVLDDNILDGNSASNYYNIIKNIKTLYTSVFICV